MSHFSVLVIGDDVEGQLAPYHEFECTGRGDEFVQSVDKTAEARKEYEADTRLRLRDESDALHDPYEDVFYREPTAEELSKHGPMIGSGCGGGISWSSRDWNDGRGYRAKVRFVPDGWEEVKVPVSDVESFAEWAQDYYGLEPLSEGQQPDLDEKHKYGHVLVRLAETGEEQVVAVVDRTNENKRWDWYELGGRWTGYFKMKPGRLSAVGSPGLMTEPAKVGYGDVAKKNDIDFDGMRDEAGDEAGNNWDKIRTVAVDLWEPRSRVRERIHGPTEPFNQERMDEARRVYREQPSVQALHGNPRTRDLVLFDADQYLVSREEYVQRARDNAVSTFAVVKDGQWYERGKMGWWGVVSDEKDDGEWNRQFAALLEELLPETMLSIVDCHI